MSSEQDPIVVTATTPWGGLALLEGRRDPALNRYDFRGLATAGRRVLSYGTGSFVLDRGQDPRAALAAVAARLPTDADPAEGAADLVRASRSWTGEDAACRDHFASIVGEATLAIASTGSEVSWLARLDARYGPAGVDAALIRMPVLAGALRVLAFKAPGAEAVEAGRRILSGEDPTLAELASCVATVLQDPGIGLVTDLKQSFRHLPAPPGAPSRWFGLLDTAIDQANAILARGIDDRPPFEGAMSFAHPGGTDAWIRQLARLLRGMAGEGAHPMRALAALLTCDRVPRDWLPRDGAALDAMSRVVEAALVLEQDSHGALRVETLIDRLQGDWSRAWDRLGPRIAKSPSVVAWGLEVADMAAAYEGQVLKPASAYAAARLRTVPPAFEGTAPVRGYAALFADKGIIAVAEASAAWHHRAGAMNDAVNALSGHHGNAFPRPFPDFVTSEGITVTPILAADALAAEGSAMRHCVGSYAGGCRDGSHAVVSVRGPDGARLSTAQLVAGGTRVEQHRALANATPPARAVAAVEALVARNVAAGMTAPGWRSRARRLRDRIRGGILALSAPAWVKDHPYDPSDPARILVAAALWEPYVTRDGRRSIPAILRGHAPDLAARLAGLGEPRPARSLVRLPLEVAANINAAGARMSPLYGIATGMFLGSAVMLATMSLWLPALSPARHRDDAGRREHRDRPGQGSARSIDGYPGIGIDRAPTSDRRRHDER